MSISVVIGTYGDLDEWATFVRRAVASVKGQAPRDLVWMHAQSLAEARNKGAMAATGEWLLFLDADDTLAPGYLAHMREYRGDASLLKPSVQYFHEDGSPRGEPHLIKPVDLTRGNHLVIGTLVRRQLFLNVGGFEDWEFYEDWALWLRCHLAGAQIAEVPGAVYQATSRRGSRNRAPRRDERVRMCREIQKKILGYIP